MRAIVFLWLVTSLVWADDFTGSVVGISEGDTVTVLDQQAKQVKIRLFGIDAPEENQAFYDESKSSLSELCFFKEVLITDKGTDLKGQKLGLLNCAGVDVNAEQVKRGMAWSANRNDKSFIELEDNAKNHRVGLWKDNNAIAPWIFWEGANYPHYFTRGGCVEVRNNFREVHVDKEVCLIRYQPKL